MILVIFISYYTITFTSNLLPFVNTFFVFILFYNFFLFSCGIVISAKVNLRLKVSSLKSIFMKSIFMKSIFMHLIPSPLKHLVLLVLYTTWGMKIPLIITKLILNADIKYYLVILYTKLGMTINEHNVLKNNNKYIKNLKFIKNFICGENY